MLYLFYFYIFLTPLEYIQEKVPKGPFGINYLNVMMALMMLWFIVRGGRRGRRMMSPGPLNALLMVFFLYTYFGLFLAVLTAGISLPITPDDPNFMWAVRLLNGYLFFWLAANMLDTRKQLRWCLYAIGLSMPLVWRAFRSDIAGRNLSSFRNELRATGSFVYLGSNELAALFLIGCVFFGLFAFAQRSWRDKIAYAAASGLYAYGVLYSYSRGTQLALAVVAGLVASLRYRWVLALLLLAAATQSLWVPASVRDRWEMTETEDGELEESAQSRTVFWALALKLFMQSPVLGTGTKSFHILNPAGMDTHNLYMRVLTEQGVAGIGLLFAVWYHVLKLSLTLWRKAPNKWDRQFGCALFMTTIGLMICNVFGDRFTHFVVVGQYWAIVGMAQRIKSHMTGFEVFADDAGGLPAQIKADPGPRLKIVGAPEAEAAPVPKGELTIVGRHRQAEPATRPL